MCRSTKAFIFTCIVLMPLSAVSAEENQDTRMFEKIFLAWTTSFNHQDLKGACALFSPKLVASYQGVLPKNYTSVCDGFKKIFKEPRRYQYHFKLHQVYRSHDLAAARITWTLEIFERNKLISVTQDEGLDVFQQDSRGDWKIVNYIGYPANVETSK